MDLSLLAIADLSVVPAERLGAAVRAAVRGGATAVELRGKEFAARDLLSAADRLGEALAGSGAPLLINDRVDVAILARAAGVHLGDEDLEVGAARALLPEGALIGRTARTAAAAEAARAAGASYLGAGRVYPGGTKPGVPIIGLEGLKAVAAATELPVVAIGGIDAARAADCVAAGAAGVAVIGSLFAGEPQPGEIESRARAIRTAVERGRRARRA